MTDEEDRLESELTKSNHALQRIGVSLGTNDEWSDQDTMLHDVEQAVAAQKEKIVNLEKELGRAYCIAFEENEDAEKDE